MTRQMYTWYALLLARATEGDTVLKMQLHRRPVWSFRQPHVQVLPMLSTFEEQHIVAVVQIGQFIQMVQL
jgi:hypothetical protein